MHDFAKYFDGGRGNRTPRDRYIVGKLPTPGDYGEGTVEVMAELNKDQVEEIVNYGTLGHGADVVREPHGRLISDSVPECVNVAYDFIKYCNKHSTYAEVESSMDGMSGGMGTKEQVIHEKIRDLLPKQESAFNLACNLMGTYFADSVKGKELLAEIRNEESEGSEKL